MDEQRICDRCGKDLGPGSHGKRRFCILCSRAKAQDGYIEWASAQNRWKIGTLESVDPMDVVPVLIDVVPKNWGFNPIYHEEEI